MGARAGAPLGAACRGGGMCRCRGVVGGGARCGFAARGELAGLPEQEELFQTVEEAGEERRNQGVQGRWQPTPLGGG